MFKLKLIVASAIMIALGVVFITQSGPVMEAKYMGLFLILLGVCISLCIILPIIKRIKRDQQIIANSRRHQEEVQISPPPPPRYNESSRRLLVPPPLN